jgi:hypothetical protein
VGDLYDTLPEPAALTRTAIVKYRCGDESFEIFCPAASLRSLEWEDTHEPVTWLHCVAAQSQDQKRQKPARTMKLLIPVQYITNIETGDKPRSARSKNGSDVGIFPPEHPNPANQLPLDQINRIITALQVPDRK